MTSQKKKLTEERAKLITDAQALAQKENYTADDDTSFNRMMDEAQAKKRQIDAIEKSEQEARLLEQPVNNKTGREDLNADGDEAIKAKHTAHKNAFAKYLRNGMGALDGDEMRLMNSMRVSLPQNTQSTTTGSQGGYTVPQGFLAQVDVAEKYYAGVLEAGATVINTSEGNDLPWPTSNDTATVASIIGQNTAATEAQVAFGQVTFKSWTYTTGLVLVPNELMQDTGIDLEGLIAQMFGERLGRGFNAHATTGDGATQPQGVITGAVAGPTGAVAAAIEFSELQDLFYSVDKAYRTNGKFMFNDTTEKLLAKKLDAENRPLLTPSYREGAGDTILGKKYVINNDMPAATAGLKSVIFGDFSKYKVRRVAGGQVRRLDERYADANQTAFLMFSRRDGRVSDAGTRPFKYLTQHA